MNYECIIDWWVFFWRALCMRARERIVNYECIIDFKIKINKFWSLLCVYSIISSQWS